jgi:DNA-binding NtrC family response regulator
MKIIVVEDDLSILETLSVYLQTIGFEAIPFSSPEIALSFYKNNPYYIVISDYSMPVISGAEFIRTVKDINPLAQCIMITGSRGEEIVVQALQAGASDFLAKPMDLSKIEESVRKAMIKLKLMPTIKKIEKMQIDRAVAVCATEKEAAEMLGINYSTLYRKKRA